MPRWSPHQAGDSTAAIHAHWVSAGAEEHGIDASAVPLVLAPLPGQPADIAIRDWDDLLNAVKGRLRLIVGEPPAATPDPPRQDSAARIQAGVLDCVAALDQLQLAMTHELSRCQHLELEVFDAQTELAQARAELVDTHAGQRLARHRALHDSLTSLPNRSYFRERCDCALAHAEPRRRALAVLYLDLDGFKPVNDVHGHATGDELVRIVAARLARAIRADDMVSRLGGDEFACLLSDLPSREQLGILACKLFDAVSAPVKIGELKLIVRPSIGIAMCPADGETVDALLENADAAMYCAKRRQTGCAFFDQCAEG